VSKLTNRHATKIADLVGRLNTIATQMYMFKTPTQQVNESLINCRRELTRVMRDMMSDFYREEATGAVEGRVTGLDRCRAGLDNAGACKEHDEMFHKDPCAAMKYGYDQCRRYQHEGGAHLPLAGGAVFDDGTWVDNWIPIYDAVKASGGIHHSAE
jgi:hypothetical protein